MFLSRSKTGRLDSAYVVFQEEELFLSFEIERGMVDYEIGSKFGLAKESNLAKCWTKLAIIHKLLHPNRSRNKSLQKRIPTLHEGFKRIRDELEAYYEESSEFLRDDGKLVERLERYRGELKQRNMAQLKLSQSKNLK